MDIGLLIVRIVVGTLFAAHGVQKLFGRLGGYGLAGTGGFFESLGFRRGRSMAFVAGATELGAGLMLAGGFLTPLAAAGLIGVMISAVRTVRRQVIGGSELDLVYAGVAAGLAFTGAGAFSLDAALGWGLAGSAWGVGALALAGVAALVTLASRRRPAQLAEVSVPEAA